MQHSDLRGHGKELLLALYTQSEWVIRTVDRVKFIDRNTVRRRIVRHFTLPSYDEALPVIDGRCLLPVFTLQKGSFISCDLRDGNDRKIALRPIEERWDLTTAALQALLTEAYPAAAEDDELWRLASRLVRSTFHDSEAALDALLSYGQEIHDSAPELSRVLTTVAFKDMARYLSKNYLVFTDVALDRDATHMISYVVDQRFVDRPQDFVEAGMAVPRRAGRFKRLLGLAPHVYLHPWSITGAGSSHLEIEAPEGVDFGVRDLRLPTRPTVRYPGTSSRHARFLAPRTAPSGEGYVRLKVHPGTGVMRSAGPAVGLLFTFIVVIVAAASIRPSAAVTLLLILPSLTSFVAARPGEHPYVTRVVRGVRYLTLSPIPLAALAGIILVAEWPIAWLWGVAVLSLSSTLVLWLGGRRLRVRPVYHEYVTTDLTRIA